DSMSPVSRRHFLATTGGVAAGVSLASPAHARAGTSDAEELPDDPFQVGVASGDALPDAVVIWTRLTTAPTEPDLGMSGQGVIPVEWRFATTPAALDDDPLAAGTVAARPEHAWAVHVDVTGLDPGRTYYYRFTAGGWTSPVGRTRTTPPGGAHVPARFAVLTCQNIARASGGRFFFHGIDHVAARDDLDFVVHVGDYIYDFGRSGHIPDRACVNLEDYRRRYGQYKSRESLRAMHARHPFYGVPDDHEFFNDVAGADPNMTPEQREQFAAGLQAFWENMPLRGGPPQPDDSGRSWLRLHRRIRWGTTLDLLLLDTRQYRVRDTTILGAEQMEWLLGGIRGSSATWTAIGSSVPLSWFPEFQGRDKWMGYDADRSALTDVLAERLAARSRRPFNPVVFSGDIHRALVTHARQRQNAESSLVATEFVTASMTSDGAVDFEANADTGAFRAQYAYRVDGTLNAYRGYVYCGVGRRPLSRGARVELGEEVEERGGHRLGTFEREQVAGSGEVRQTPGRRDLGEVGRSCQDHGRSGDLAEPFDCGRLEVVDNELVEGDLRSQRGAVHLLGRRDQVGVVLVDVTDQGVPHPGQLRELVPGHGRPQQRQAGDPAGVGEGGIEGHGTTERASDQDGPVDSP
ncbi:MAG TPA: alkaline phosphatase D family protein, partial [Actinopolymorphaceae bacterium]